ncbi:MAG: portal protein [Gammaproteobacteria bacterium]|nr:MAG: portal protein [Gammaproteobacteria bacterium]
MLLIAASVAVTLFKHLKLGSVLGLLVAGVIVGPHSPGPHITTHVEDVRHFTELGVVLLLFLIGLEMKPQRLWAMRRDVFGLGSLQIVLSGMVIAVYVAYFITSWQIALLIGLTLALSSTAFVMQILQERGDIASKHGTVSFAILLMQDLAIVPLLAIVPILSPTGTLSDAVPLWEQVLIVIGMLLLTLAFGRYVVPFALDHLAKQSNREGFLMMVMLAVFFAAWAMHQAGLSMALGAFLMGMLLSGSRYNLQIQALIEPYKGILMSLFFVAVGMSIDLQTLFTQPWEFIQHTLAIVAIKIAVLFLILLAFKFPRNILYRVTFLLSQCGEFGFVLFGSARALEVIDNDTFIIGIGVISVTMLITPLLVRLGDALAIKHEQNQPVTDEFRYPGNSESSAKVILGGYGRVGHAVATLLHSSHIPFIAFDTNLDSVAQGKQDGFPVYYGDIGDPELIAAAHVENAALVVLTIDHGPTALRVVRHLRSAYPNLPVIARARDLESCGKLLQAGATEAYPEAIESSLRLAANALQMLGVPADNVDMLLSGVRLGNYSLVRAPSEKTS